MTLTTERLREIAEDGFLEHGDAKLMARALLANREAQPVLCVDMDTDFIKHIQKCSEDVAKWPEWKRRGADVTKFTAPPAPAVPEEAKVGEMPFLGNSEPGYVRGWNACRAAMLAQPVSSGYKLPGGWIACSERMPEVGERDWRTALPVLVKCEIGVIPAYYGFTYHEGEQCFGFMESIKFGDGSGSGPEQHENRLMMHVTHWMPLPAAPEGGNNSSST